MLAIKNVATISRSVWYSQLVLNQFARYVIKYIDNNFVLAYVEIVLAYRTKQLRFCSVYFFQVNYNGSWIVPYPFVNLLLTKMNYHYYNFDHFINYRVVSCLFIGVFGGRLAILNHQKEKAWRPPENDLRSLRLLGEWLDESFLEPPKSQLVNFIFCYGFIYCFFSSEGSNY